MKEQKQKYRHQPPEFIGDCHRTAIACVLDLDRDDVPHFGEVHWHEPEKFYEAFDRWLENQGYAQVSLAWDGENTELQQVLDGIGCFNPELYWLLGGKSKNGTNHTVVCRGNAIVWDPAIDGSGIVGPSTHDDGTEPMWYATFITTLQMRGKAEGQFNAVRDLKLSADVGADKWPWQR